MATHFVSEISPDQQPGWSLIPVASFPRLRALAWHEATLYASRGYELLRAQIDSPEIRWQQVARCRAPGWRRLTSSSRLSSRLFRDGFHALAVLSTGHLIAAVPNAIVTLPPGGSEFRIVHSVLRGTRPLHITVTPDDRAFWGEYFDNPQREQVHIYVSCDRGATWDVAHTFPAGAIRHVHNIVHDPWGKCLWVLTGDEGAECRILRASEDFRHVDCVLSGSQQTRSAALIPTQEGVYFSSDTPSERNHVYRLDRNGKVTELAGLASSSIYGCHVEQAIFFSTMVEPSQFNPERTVGLYGSQNGQDWQRLLQWTKDRWPMGLFQYGNALLPDGHNSSGVLAVSTIATEGADLQTSLWRVHTV